MFKLITWNIQSGRSPDGATSLDRIIACLDRFSDFDVLCLQEVACGHEARDGSACGDQFAGLAARLPGYAAVSGIAADTLHPRRGRRLLGSMILARHPVLQVLRHSLPWPADPAVPSMPRIALEATLDTPLGVLGVTCAHLEYFSERQRSAQVDRLRELRREAHAHARAQAERPPEAAPGDAPFSPFAPIPRGAAAILAGDFNMLPQSPEYLRLLAPFGDGTPPYRDAWQVAQPGRRHAPTVGLHDDTPEAGLPFTFDFAFVSANLAPGVRRVRVDGSEEGSDHQALLLELD
jgi:endonuclease/exonuclease/phosphatase family metal-dependent hydrolase